MAKKKDGYMFRAVVAWIILNIILLGTLGVVVWIVGGYQVWFIQLPLVVAIIGSEWAIMVETIGPVIRDWIRQEQDP